MNPFLTSYKSQALLIIAFWQIGLIFSMEFLLSLCMIAIIALALFERAQVGDGFRLQWRSGLKAKLQNFFSNRAFIAVMVPFFLVLITALYSSELNYTLERLRIKIPFLLLPFTFFNLPDLSKRDIQKVLLFQLFISFVACLGVCVNYLINFSAITTEMLRGGAMPTPGNHIRFSLMIAFAIVGGLYLVWTRFQWKYSWERMLILLMSLLLFVGIHVLSVRSGLLVLYITMVLLLLRYIFFSRRYLLGVSAIVLLLAVPVIAYVTIPSVKAKVAYMRYDLKMYLSGNGANYSDSERLISLQVGMDVGNQNNWLGVGAGDLRRVIKDKYAADHPKVNMRMPHNQLITVYAGTGLIGLIIFLGGFFYPLFEKRRFTNGLFLAIHSIIFFSFMMESTIESAVGIAFYLLYLLLLLRYLK